MVLVVLEAARRFFSAAFSSSSVGSFRVWVEGHGACWYETLPLITHLFIAAACSDVVPINVAIARKSGESVRMMLAPNAKVQGRPLGVAEARSGGGVPCNAQLGR